MTTRHLRLREFLAGLQGLALMRGLFTAPDEVAQRRIEELRTGTPPTTAICALALEHVKDIGLRSASLRASSGPEAPVIISESHPFLRALGGAPYSEDTAGSSGVVRSHNHSHGDYLDAFAVAGLEVRRCIEVRFGPEEVAMQRYAVEFFPDATEAAFLGLPARSDLGSRRPRLSAQEGIEHSRRQ